MKKSEISNILIELWNMSDQAPFDEEIKSAFRNCPIEWQKSL